MIFVIVGASGSGKSSLVKAGQLYYKMQTAKKDFSFIEESDLVSRKAIIKLFGENITVLPRKKDNVLAEACTHTSREIRPGETSGKDYYFVGKEYFEKNKDRFVETTHYDGNCYGLSKKELEQKLRESEVCTVVMDRDGAKKVKSLYGDRVVTIFLKVSPDRITQRMKHRGDSFECIQKRIQHAIDRGELDFCLADYEIDANNELSQMLKEFVYIVEYHRSNSD